MSAELPFEKINRDILIRKESKTNPDYGCDPYNQPIEKLLVNGIINIDKPRGPTSHQVSDYLQKILGIMKAGHSGTLDPGVTGVLPIAYGRATRIVQFLLKAGKEYVCLMHIHKPVEQEKLIETINMFTGNIEQLPPIKSAVKRRVRKRNVYYAEILDVVGQDVLLKIGCQAGTYIRKWCHDVGQALGTGAHMAELRRTKAGPFTEETAVYLQDVADAIYFYKEKNNETFLRKILLPVETAVEHLPKVWLFDNAINTICNGASIAVPGISKLHTGINKNDYVAVMSLKNELICVGTALMDSADILNTDKGIAVKSYKVFMEPGTYPSLKSKSKENK